MKIRQYSALAALLLLVAGCGNSEGEGKAKSQDKDSDPPVVAAETVPEDLRNAAYEYYGLSYEGPLTYSVQMTKELPPRDGTQTVKFEGMEDGAAKFTVTRTGGLSRIGSETLLLNDEGVFTKAISTGVLDSPALQVPADLALDSEWESEMAVKIGLQNNETRFVARAVREEETTVEAGTFDCLVIEADMTSQITGSADATKDGEATMKIVVYYSKGIGYVKMTLEGNQADGTDVNVYIEPKSIGEE